MLKFTPIINSNKHRHIFDITVAIIANLDVAFNGKCEKAQA
jgi:hypothetical protein